jgi:hypothetical protein
MPLVLTGDGAVGPLSASEVGFLDGVTSSVQTQLDGKLITPGIWISYVPTWTNISSTGGSSEGKYIQIGKTVVFWARYIVGSSNISVSGGVYPSLPVAQASGWPVVSGSFLDFGNNYFPATMWGIGMYATNVSGTFAYAQNLSATTPFTWSVNDSCILSGTYEAA